MNHVPYPQRGQITLASGRWRKPQAGHLGRLSLSTPGVAMLVIGNPRPAFTELEKIEELAGLRNSRGFDEFQESRALDFAELLSTHTPLRSRTMIG